MYGFLISTQPAEAAFPEYGGRVPVIGRRWDGKNLHIRQVTLDKFTGDKLFADTGDFFVATEGVLLNLAELKQRHHTGDTAELFVRLYRERGETFFSVLRGSFSGVFYDKAKDLLLVFTDQQGSKLLFYDTRGGSLCISSSLPWLAAQCGRCGWSEAGLLELLTFGYSPSCRTVLDGILRVGAGNYLRVTNGAVQELTYHRFTNRHCRHTTAETLRRADELFRQAVRRVTDKNTEYGYGQYIPLSGGLDSRMITRVALEQTSETVCNFTYGTIGSPDERLSRQVAEAFGARWTFQSQEGGSFLERIDEAVLRSDMQLSYAGPAESYNALLELPPDRTGIIPTGVGGDNLFHSLFHRTHRRYAYGDFSLSGCFYPEQKGLIPADYARRFENRNIHSLYTRIFYCHNFGAPLTYQCEAESYSVFMDVDLMEYVLAVPEWERKNYRFYDRWVLSFYPDAARILHNDHQIGRREPVVEIMGRSVPVRDVMRRAMSFVLRKAGVPLVQRPDASKSPNPTEQWLEENSALRECWDRYFHANIGLLDAMPRLQAHVCSQYLQTRDCQQRFHALTVLSAVRLLHPRTDSI